MIAWWIAAALAVWALGVGVVALLLSAWSMGARELAIAFALALLWPLLALGWIAVKLWLLGGALVRLARGRP